MLRPDRDGFVEAARRYAVVPVWRELSADTLTPVGAFIKAVGDERGFLLESVEHGERWGRFSFVGRRPAATLLARGRDVHYETSPGPPGPPGSKGRGAAFAPPAQQGVLAELERMLGFYRSPRVEDLPPLHGGLVGYLGYDVVREIERLPGAPPDTQGHPDAILYIIGQLAAFDHWRQRVFIVENVFVDREATSAELASAYEAAGDRIGDLAAELSEPVPEALCDPPELGEELPSVRRSVDPATWERGVEVAKEHIRAGDVFQVVLSQRYDLDLSADPFDVYRVLRQINPSPYMYFFRHPEVTVVGSSPEPMVQLSEARVISRPIAGTRRRGRSEQDDRRMAGELTENPKERAEHAMLVDLARNDVGRVVTFGTERVDELMVLERYSHVMHMTSQVSGELAPGLGPVDVLRATFPAGTVSGAPKVRAMEIIDDLEGTKRGPYAGVVGYLDFSGNLDTAIAIRTMLVGPDGTASVQAGAGIVADSDPADEDKECSNKAAALLAAVPAARRMTAARLASPRA